MAFRMFLCFQIGFNLRKSEILGTVDRNVHRNSLENSRELVRNREEKFDRNFLEKKLLEKIRVKSGKKNSREKSCENWRKIYGGYNHNHRLHGEGQWMLVSKGT